MSTTTINKDLYDALKSANVTEEQATKAAASVLSEDDNHLATKDDLHKLESRLIMWVVGSVVLATLVQFWVA